MQKARKVSAARGVQWGSVAGASSFTLPWQYLVSILHSFLLCSVEIWALLFYILRHLIHNIFHMSDKILFTHNHKNNMLKVWCILHIKPMLFLNVPEAWMVVIPVILNLEPHFVEVSLNHPSNFRRIAPDFWQVPTSEKL